MERSDVNACTGKKKHIPVRGCFFGFKTGDYQRSVIPVHATPSQPPIKGKPPLYCL